MFNVLCYLFDTNWLGSTSETFFSPNYGDTGINRILLSYRGLLGMGPLS